MKRLQRTAVVSLCALGLTAGCANFGNGPIMSRIRGHRPDCAGCEVEASAPICDGPMLTDSVIAGPMLSAPPPVSVPLQAPPPRMLIDPAAPQAAPASPASRSKGN